MVNPLEWLLLWVSGIYSSAFSKLANGGIGHFHFLRKIEDQMSLDICGVEQQQNRLFFYHMSSYDRQSLIVTHNTNYGSCYVPGHRLL